MNDHELFAPDGPITGPPGVEAHFDPEGAEGTEWPTPREPIRVFDTPLVYVVGGFCGPEFLYTPLTPEEQAAADERRRAYARSFEGRKAALRAACRDFRETFALAIAPWLRRDE